MTPTIDAVQEAATTTTTANDNGLDVWAYHDAEFIGLHPDALASDPFFAKDVEIAVGANRHEKHWRTIPLTRGKLVHDLIKFDRGPKDGACITQGPLIGGQRIAKNAIANHIMMLDCDTGEGLDSLEDKVRSAGLCAVMWTTYSHLKPQTEIPEDKLVTLARDTKRPVPSQDDQPALIALAREYLAAKRVKPEVLDGIVRVDRKHVDGGIKFIVHHGPMPRARVLMFLKSPYVFASAKSTQALAIEDWKQAYAGVAEMLGVDYDQSCVDPSRLMYTPRISADADIGQHSIRVIAGDALDLDAVPRVARGARGAPSNALLAAAGGTTASGGTYPQWFRAFLKNHNDFDIIGFCDAYGELLSNNGEKAELTCPNEDRHTEQKADDRAFCVGTGDSWWTACQHATCKEDSAGDRAWWLWKLCEKYGAGERELLDYCPSATDKEKDKATGTTDAAPTGGYILPDGAVLRVADDPEFGFIDADGCVWYPTRARQRKADNMRDAVKLFETFNKADPRFFRFKNTPLIVEVVNPDDKGATINPVENFEKQAKAWLTMEKHLVFFVWGEVLGMPGTFQPGEVTNEVPPGFFEALSTQQARIAMPTLQGLMPVQYFIPDPATGKPTLPSARGYDAATGYYLDPSPDVEIVTLPDVISKEDARAAAWEILEISQDAPLTDVLYDTDPRPLKLELPEGYDASKRKRSLRVDADGWQWPNWWRGKGSRSALHCMLFQPFLRPCIRGACPSYPLDKPEIGTGATMFGGIPFALAMNKEKVPVKTMDKSPERFKAAITASLINDEQIIMIDNIKATVDSPDLEALITGGAWSDRVLGVSKNVEIDIKAQIITTGNGVKYSRDILRRQNPIILNAESDDPSSGREFKHDPLDAWVWENRNRLRRAVYTVIGYWVQQGRIDPKTKRWQGKHGKARMGSFEDYARIMSGLLDTITGLKVPGYRGFLWHREAWRAGKRQRLGSGLERVTEAIVAGAGADTFFRAIDAVRHVRPDSAALTAAADKFAKITSDPELGLDIEAQTEEAFAKKLAEKFDEYLGKTVTVEIETGGGPVERVKVTWSAASERLFIGGRYRRVTGYMLKQA